jgi:hypothetical protein
MGFLSYLKNFTAWVLLKGALASIPAIGAGTAVSNGLFNFLKTGLV